MNVRLNIAPIAKTHGGEKMTNRCINHTRPPPINRNLEAMARQLYDYWFVQFDFPDENGRPYKSSGGNMVWNDKLKREIPEKWTDCNLQRYIGRITNGLNPRQNFVLGTGNNYYVSIRSLEGRDINWDSCEKCDDLALAKINSRSQLQCGDVIFSAIGTIGRTYYIQENPDNWNISETSFTIRSSEDIPSSFFYELLVSPEIQMQADKNAMGSTMRCLVMDALCKIPTIDISLDIVNRFDTLISPIHKAIYESNKEKRKLLRLRDELLPLLMNGQVSVMPSEVNCDLVEISLVLYPSSAKLLPQGTLLSLLSPSVFLVLLFLPHEPMIPNVRTYIPCEYVFSVECMLFPKRWRAFCGLPNGQTYLIASAMHTNWLSERARLDGFS